MKTLDLSEFSKYEKYDWLVEAVGGSQAAQVMLECLQIKPEKFIKDCEAWEEFVEFCAYEFISKNFDSVDILDALEASEGTVEKDLNDLLREHELDIDHGADDGFNSQHEFNQWRNS